MNFLRSFKKMKNKFPLVYIQNNNFLLSHHVRSMCTKRKYCNRTIEKKSILFMNVHVLYVLKHKTSKKKFRLSVCLSVCLSACTLESINACRHIWKFCLLSTYKRQV